MATHELITPFVNLAHLESINRALRIAYLSYSEGLQGNPNLSEAVFYRDFRRTLSSSDYPVESLPPEYFPKTLTLGLRPIEVTPVVDVALELVSNVWHGVAGAKLSADLIMTDALFLSEEQIDERDNILIEAFKVARGQKLPKGFLKIGFNRETVEGLVEVRHPVVPEYSAPPIRRETNFQILRDEKNSRGRRGGLYSIENGIINQRLIDAGLYPDEQVIFQEEPGSRKVSLHFKRI